MLEAAGVTKRFAGVPALRGVDFLVERGQVHALVGEHGAGKSTLVKVITGVYKPDAGLVFLRGKPVRFAGPADALAHGVSTLFQEPTLVDSMSVAANLYLGREPRNRLGLISFKQLYANATRLLDWVGINVDPRGKLRLLTPDMRRMVAFARAVDIDSGVVVLDEPTSLLKPSGIDRVLDAVKRLRERGVSVLYVSQQLAEASQVCDKITVLRDGEVVHAGS